MSFGLDLPQHLMMVLSLAAATVRAEPPGSPAPQPAAATAIHQTRLAAGTGPREGPYRFSEQVWLRALKELPATPGGEQDRELIFVTSSGRYYVPAAGPRDLILAARHDPERAAAVARALAEDNARALQRETAVEATAADLYVAHMAGRPTALALVKLAKTQPQAQVAKVLPALLAALPQLAHPGAKPLTIGEADSVLRHALGVREEAPVVATVEAQPGSRLHFADGRLKGPVAIERRAELPAFGPKGGLASASAWSTHVRPGP